MGLLDSIKGIFSPGSAGAAAAPAEGFFFYVRCRRGHPIRIWVHRAHDLARDYDGGDAAYTLTKYIVCPTCYQKSEVRMTFDARYREQGREIDGATFIDASEFEPSAS